MPEADYEDINTEDFLDEDPLPGKRDPRIFARKKEKEDKDEEFDEDKFV